MKHSAVMAVTLGFVVMVTATAMIVMPSRSTHAAAAASRAAPELSPYIKVHDLTVSLYRNMSVTGLFTVNLELELADPTQRDKTGRSITRLRDAYLSTIAMFADAGMRVDKPAHLPTLIPLLQRTTDRILGPGTAEVLLHSATTWRR